MIPDFVQPWMRVAYRELAFGPVEVAGPEAHPRILQYLAEGAPALGADLRETDETSWCAAFVGYCLLHGLGVEGTGQGLARSYLTWGRPAGPGTWGSVVVLKRGREPWMGHVGFCIGYNGEEVSVLGGNQSDRVCIRNFDVSDVLDWRLP